MNRDLQSVLDAILDGILLIGLDGIVEQVNSEACRILEASADAIRGSSADRLLGPESDGVVQLIKRVSQSGQPAIRDDLLIDRRSGTGICLDVSVSPLLDDSDGSSTGVVVVLRDRTISNSLRDEVSQREQLATYGHIAAGIAHEVKNPLGGIRGAGELLERWSDDDRARRAAQMIVGEVDRISDLVEELMVFARGDQLELAPVNLHRILNGVIDLTQLDPIAAGLKITRLYDPSIPDIIADEDRLKQVFINLVRNGMQAIEGEGGELEIETRMTLDQRLAGHDGHTLPTVQIRVRDSGRGIEPENLDRVTTPFFTTREKGTGLGLALAHHWIKRHFGTLRFTSQPGEGTIVRVNLPLETDANRSSSDERETP